MPLALVTPPATSPGEHVALVQMFKRGLLRLHIRKPTESKEAHIRYIESIPQEFHDRLVLHDFHELAEDFNLGGLHYRERCLPKDSIVAPPRMTVSIGFHKPRLMGIDRGEVDYCFLSPIFQSISKIGYCPPAELQDKKAVRNYIAESKQPVFALGGVSASKFEDLADMGFSGAALLGAVWDAKDPVAAVERALEIDAKTEWNELSQWPFYVKIHEKVPQTII